MPKALTLLAKSLEKFMQDRGIRQADLARLMNKQPQAINRFVKAEVDHQMSVLDDLSEALGVEPYELLIDHSKQTDPYLSDLLRRIGSLDKFQLRLIEGLLKSIEGNVQDEALKGKQKLKRT